MFIFANQSYGKERVMLDVYGTQQISANKIKKQFNREIKQIATILQSTESLNSKKNIQLFSKLMTNIISEIKKEGDFAYVNLSPILYPGDPVVHITIDIVDKKDQKRLSYFYSRPSGNIPDPHQLIKTWLEYERAGRYDIFKNACLTRHCLYGFNDAYFDQLVPSNKLAITTVLRKDKNDHKRAVAAFLLAHIKDSHELVKILTYSIRDPNPVVRNNVMRVLGETLNSNPISFPIEEAVKALDFPTTTDRNKALMIIAALVKQPRYAAYVAKHAKPQLLAELKLSQPNVHLLAYQILKKISGKNYSDRDYRAWEREI